MRRAGDAARAGRSRLTRMNGAVLLHSWTSRSSSGSTSSTPLRPAVHGGQVGDQTTRVDGGAGRDPRRRRRARCQRPRRHLGGASLGALPAAPPMAPASAAGCASLVRPNVMRSGTTPRGQRFGLGGGERGVGAGAAAHGLRRVVDEDVERSLLAHRVGERHDLCRVAQVDPHDVQPVQPVRAVRQPREAAYGVVREARRDRRVRAVAQQAERDVHPDLRPPTGEEGAASREVRAGLPLGVVLGRALRTHLVVERVDLGVAALADVAASAAGSACRRGRRRRTTRAAGPRSRRRSGPEPRSRWRRSPPGRRRGQPDGAQYGAAS